MQLRFLLLVFLLDVIAASFHHRAAPRLQKRRREIAERALQAREKPVNEYPAYNFSTPIDHFHNESQYAPHSNGFYNMRYWFDDTYYRPGGPVIVLCSGEDSGVYRLPYLHKGIVYILAKATGGMGVVLEHRYYGTSFPVPNLSTENMRFLTTDQAMADTAYFAQNMVFPGHEDKNLTSYTTPWIAYGGSYAGAFVAFLRKLYPQTFFGAISSSGVSEAIWDYWEYYEPIRKYGPPTCISRFQYLLNVIDRIAMNHTDLIPDAKAAFGLTGITHTADFTTILNLGLQYWQELNWDPAVSYPDFGWFCGNMSANTLLWPDEEDSKALARKFIDTAGYGDQASSLILPMQNFFGWSKNYIRDYSCLAYGETLDECYGTYNATYYQLDALSQYNTRSWPYQYCNQWGFLQTGSGVPANQLSLISRLATLRYTSNICRLAFGITAPPDTAYINRLGGFNISYRRLAIVNGQIDPWRPATPASPAARPWDRPNTLDQPFHIINEAVHHWDENGLLPYETTKTLPPEPINHTHHLEVAWVTYWLTQWKGHPVD